MIDPGTIARLRTQPARWREAARLLDERGMLAGSGARAETYRACADKIEADLSALLALADAVNSAPVAEVEWTKNHADGGYTFGTIRAPDGFTGNSVRLVALPEGE